jgi:hypothetical protein
MQTEASNRLSDWERTLESLDELSLDELLALTPQVRDALSRSIEELRSGKLEIGDGKRLNAVIGKVLTGVQARIKAGRAIPLKR